MRFILFLPYVECGYIKLLFIYVCIRWAHSCHVICGGQRTSCESWLSPLIIWGLGIELRLSRLGNKYPYLLSHLTGSRS